MQRRQAIASIATATVSCRLPLARAESYPSRPLRAIVPFSPGGGTDLLARMVFKGLSEAIGQPIVVDNKPGAGGIVGFSEMARAKADGYTVGIGGDTIPILGLLYDNLSFDPKSDLESVVPLATVPVVLIAGPAIPIASIKELLAYAKSRSGGAIGYATPGISTPHHLAGALLGKTAGIKLSHVPYKGSAGALTDVIGGHVPLAIVGLPSAIQASKSGQIKILGVATATRSTLALEIPTIAEMGLPGYDASYWWDVVIPRGVPRPVVERLHRELVALLQTPSMRDSLMQAGFEPMVMGRGEMVKALAVSNAKWEKVIRETNFRGQ